ncbi:MAG: aspartate-semialdehyde dehydrogenase [Calditrichaceae bacterium]|nr:aspartate-semialdehyde dehydrogenase [Calditrichaceae bacterium]RQV92734.1 MAG: aspartate-semialdehyde dehydrogenase [Calditrichota bacterium]
MSKKIKAGILGATGSVGQKFIELLNDHPYFEITALGASERSAGKIYQEAANWFMTTPMPEKVKKMKVQLCEPGLDCQVAFSALDASIAGEIEKKFAQAGYFVISNARNHRYEKDVPLLVPEINPGHLDALAMQQYGKGKIVTNPNCSTTGQVMALKPLQDAFGLDAVHVVTMQALSGAGYPGVPSLDIMDNVIPYIGGEEEKMEKEPLKILGKFIDGQFINAEFKISASCNRVPVVDGHLEAVSVKLKQKASAEDIIRVLQAFKPAFGELQLPSAPKKPIHYFHENNMPQPRLLRNLEGGMAVSIGRVRPCNILDFKFLVLSHNTVRGAAGGAILNAEIMAAENIIR